MLFPIGLLSLVLFVVLGIIAKTGPLSIDTRIALWFKAHRTPSEVHWAQILSAMTRPIIVFAVIVLLLLFHNYWHRSWSVRAFVPLALVGSCAVLSTWAKSYFDRVRPGAGLATLVDLEPSYPSSHTVFITAAGCSFLFFARRQRLSILVTVALAACFIGVVRLTLGVHWFTDIVGSAFLAFGMWIIFYVIDDWLAEKERNSL